MDARCNAASAPPDAPPLRPAVVCLMRYDPEHEAIRIADGADFGLHVRKAACLAPYRTGPDRPPRETALSCWRVAVPHQG